MPVAELLARDPAAVILSGGPASVYAEGALSLDPALLAAGVPVFGMCYGFQAMAQALGARSPHRHRRVRHTRECHPGTTLFRDQPAQQSVWMSHGDSVTVARSACGSPGRRPARRSPPSRTTSDGCMASSGIRRSCTRRTANACSSLPLAGRRDRTDWTPANVVDELVASVREQVGPAGPLRAVRRVDSSVAAALVQRAVGDH